MNYLFYILLQKTGESQTVEKLRTNLWDEENRLRAVDITPDAEGVRPIAIYTYDAGGERILKHSNTSVSIYLNGKKVADTIQVDATLYPSGMTVFRPSFGGEGGGAYTKHYYAGTQRVSSKIGTTENLGDFLQDWFTGGIGGPVDIIGSSFGVLENAENGVVQVYDELGIEPPTYDSDPVFIPVASFIHGNDENEIYWFHPDHLGSTSYITNLLGEVSQHMEYFAFGETFVEEHRSSNNSPYKFNGKELDEETGWYYYGARYYDPRTSVWLSVDPLAEKYPSYSPYTYCLNNPVIYTDPDGRDVVPIGFNLNLTKFFRSISKTSGYKTIFNRFLGNQDNVFISPDNNPRHYGYGPGTRVKPNGYGEGYELFIGGASYLSNSGDLIVDPTFMAKVLVHEGLHLKWALIEDEGKLADYPTLKKHMNRQSDPTFTNSKGGMYHGHHEAMAEGYISVFVETMRGFDAEYGTEHSDDWYNAMAWMGSLSEYSNAYQNLDSSTRTNYNKIIRNETRYNNYLKVKANGGTSNQIQRAKNKVDWNLFNQTRTKTGTE